MPDSTVSLSPTAAAATRPEFIQLHHEDHAAVRAELIAGLMAPAAFTSPKYLYDALGSRLFEAITELPEYYPTRTEAAIFKAHAAAMAALLPPACTLVDLGAGNCAKAAGLFEAFAPARYVAVDISVAFLRQALGSLQAPRKVLVATLWKGLEPTDEESGRERRLPLNEMPSHALLVDACLCVSTQ